MGQQPQRELTPARDQLVKRGLKARMCFWRLFVAFFTVVLALYVLHFVRNEFLLDVRGERTSALVEQVVLSKSDVIHIAYTPRGADRTVRTTVQSLLGKDPRVGTLIPIDYDPHDPARTREAGNHDALLLVPLLLGFVGFTLWQVLRAGGFPRRRRRG